MLRKGLIIEMGKRRNSIGLNAIHRGLPGETHGEVEV